jgi:hypothetical protein
MNETEFQEFLNKLEALKPSQFERVFELLHQHFRHNRNHFNMAISWRCKQAWMLIKNQKVKPS